MQLQEKNLHKLRDEFNDSLKTLRERYEARLAKLRAELELRRKVEIHEIEERKNLHINDLIRSHEASFTEIKKYYNDITKDNLKLIRLLKVRACMAVALTTGRACPAAMACTHRACVVGVSADPDRRLASHAGHQPEADDGHRPGEQEAAGATECCNCGGGSTSGGPA